MNFSNNSAPVLRKGWHAMDEKELAALTRKTAEQLLGPLKPGEGVYALWREFDRARNGLLALSALLN